MNVKNFSKEIKKDLKEAKEKSTETITIRVTIEEKKRFVRLAKACKISRTQLFKKLIQGADLKAIPPAEIYEIAKDLSAIREFILEYCLEGEPVRAYVAAIESMNEHNRPMIRVVAKPLIGPVPKLNRMIPVMIDVIFESKIAENAFL